MANSEELVYLLEAVRDTDVPAVAARVAEILKESINKEMGREKRNVMEAEEALLTNLSESFQNQMTSYRLSCKETTWEGNGEKSPFSYKKRIASQRRSRSRINLQRTKMPCRRPGSVSSSCCSEDDEIDQQYVVGENNIKMYEKAVGMLLEELAIEKEATRKLGAKQVELESSYKNAF